MHTGGKTMASTPLSSSMQASRRMAWTASVALLGITYFVLSIIALHFLRPDLNPIQHPTSAYAVGAYGWLMTSAFFSVSLAWFALVRGLAQGVKKPARSRLGLGFLSLWAVGVLISMVFPMDMPGTPPTAAGMIHDVTGPLAFLSLTLGMILVSWGFKDDMQWRPFRRAALALSVIMVIGYVATFLSIAAGTDYLGLCQRIALATSVVWLACVAVRLRSIQH
jgi:hypothetical protein